MRGPDWAIAIHTAPRQRDQMFRSPLDQDKHITEGCINVEPGTMRQLSRLLPRGSRTPIYILPMDEQLTSRLF